MFDFITTYSNLSPPHIIGYFMVCLTLFNKCGSKVLLSPSHSRHQPVSARQITICRHASTEHTRVDAIPP